MTKINCDVIRDMLPLYVEDLVSDSTRTIVEEHLSMCEKCRKEKISLCTEMQVPSRSDDTKAIQRIGNTLLRKKIATIVVSVFTMLLIFVLIAVNQNAPIVLSYEDVKDSIRVVQEETGEFSIHLTDPSLKADVEYGTGEDGIYTVDVSCYTTKWLQRYGNDSGNTTIKLKNGANPIQRIHYYPSFNGEDSSLYEAASISDNSSSGYEILPRLVLNYYMIFAALAAVVGVIVCVCLRKQTHIAIVAVKVTMVPVMYFLSSILILTGKGDVYNSLYYFSGILLSTLLMSMIGWGALALIRYRKIKSANPVEKNF